MFAKNNQTKNKKKKIFDAAAKFKQGSNEAHKVRKKFNSENVDVFLFANGLINGQRNDGNHNNA